MKHEYSSDAIAMYEGKLVLVERLKSPQGLALPGGRRDLINGELEDPAVCAVRELEEETGLHYTIEGYLARYDKEGRDPRGPKTSDVFYGTAMGNLRNEEGCTKVKLISVKDVEKHKDEFAFDHYQIIQDWITSYS